MLKIENTDEIDKKLTEIKFLIDEIKLLIGDDKLKNIYTDHRPENKGATHLLVPRNPPYSFGADRLLAKFKDREKDQISEAQNTAKNLLAPINQNLLIIQNSINALKTQEKYITIQHVLDNTGIDIDEVYQCLYELQKEKFIKLHEDLIIPL